MKNKIILAVIVILAIVLIGGLYYVKNVMIIPDKSKSGRVERASGDWIKRKKKDETNY